MTHRERLLATLRGQPVDRIPDYEFGAWDETYPRWHREGMPKRFTGCDPGIVKFFHTDEESFGPQPDVQISVLPGFQERVLERRGDHLIKMDGDGATVEMMVPGMGVSIPRYIRYAIETREDWEHLKAERLVIGDPKRFGADLEERCRLSREADWPVQLWCGSLYGWLRNWLGVERFSEVLMEEPEWAEEMMDHLTNLMLDGYRRIAGKAKVDLGWWWEDMCFKNGPLMSPKLFKQMMVPRYRKVADFLRHECGCEFQMVDCDGRINELAPLWLEAGINVMFPLEAPHTDAFAIRRALGDRMAFRGYFDKRALIAGPDAIDAEFDRIMPLIRGGRFIPHTDHRVPPDVPLDHYRYYRRQKCRIIGKEYREG